MKVVILAGGLGTRLKPITETIPKVMIDIGGKPLLQRTIEILSKKGFKDFVIVTSYKKEQIMDYFGHGEKFGVKIKYVFQENPKGGTADAVKYSENEIKDKFLLIYGDNIFDSKAIDLLAEKNKFFDGVLCGREAQNPKNYGVLLTDRNRVLKIIEKSENPPTNLVMTGLFVLPKDIFSAIKETRLSLRGEYELTDSIQILIDRGLKIGLAKFKGKWLDPNNENELKEAEKFFAESPI